MDHLPSVEMKRYNVEGSWPALVTPFTEGDEVNYGVLRNLVEYHAENGSNGLLLLGSTAEGFLLTKDCLLYTSPSPRDRS